MWYLSWWFFIICICLIASNVFTLIYGTFYICNKCESDTKMIEVLPVFYKNIWHDLRTECNLNRVGSVIVLGLWSIAGCISFIFIFAVVYFIFVPCIGVWHLFSYLFSNKKKGKQL